MVILKQAGRDAGSGRRDGMSRETPRPASPGSGDGNWNFRFHVLSLPRAKVPGSENSTYGISSLLGAKVRGMWPIGDILLFVLFLAGATIAADAARPTSIVSTVLLQSWTEVKAQGFGNIRRERAHVIMAV